MQIHGVFLPSEYDTNQLKQMVETLPLFIRKRMSRYRKIEDQYRTLLGYLLLKKQLSDIYGIKKDEILLTKDLFGKPYLIDQPIQFNISHSENMVVCVIDEQAVGVDVEMQRVQGDALEIAKRFFAKSEYEQLMEVSEDERMSVFYKIWTAKESYIKYTGKGLFMNLNSFEIDCREKPTALIGEESCFFQYYLVENTYHVHVCSRTWPCNHSINFVSVNQLLT